MTMAQAPDERRQRRFRLPVLVLFDGNCTLCKQTMRLVKALDWLAQIEPVNALDRQALAAYGLDDLDPDALLTAMHVVIGERMWSGFPACRVIAGRLPLCWPVWPLLFVWPIPLVGRRIYRRVADQRSCRPTSGPPNTPRA